MRRQRRAAVAVVPLRHGFDDISPSAPLDVNVLSSIISIVPIARQGGLYQNGTTGL